MNRTLTASLKSGDGTYRSARWGRACGAAEYVVAWIVAIVWLQSSAAHIANPYFFLSTVYQYELLGETPGWVVATFIPAVQITLGVCLIGRMFVDGAWSISILLLVVFSFVQLSALSRDLGIACGCFGNASSQPIGLKSIGTVLSLLLLASVACLLRLRSAGHRSQR